MPPIRSIFRNWFIPAVCLALLLWMSVGQLSLPRAEMFDRFHERAAAAIEDIPLTIGPWVGSEREPEKAALELLKPNAIRSVEFTDSRSAAVRRNQRLYLTVVQCRRVEDMLGHFPPRCYPGYGDVLQSSQSRRWQVGGETIEGVEYRFDRTVNGVTRRRIVYNFMVVPLRGIVPDMKALEEAADDYQQRHYGAAQFQVVFDTPAGSELSTQLRDDIFVTLISHAQGAIRVLREGEL